MKKIVSIIAIAVAVSVSANAQSVLGNFLGTLSDYTSSNVVEGLVGTFYTAPVSLNGTYNYGGVAIAATSSEGGVVANLAGSAVTGGIESKADEYLAKVGIKPGIVSFTFNASDNTFVMKYGSVSLPGTYKVGDGEKTVTLTFGKSMKFFCMTGTLESSLNGAKMLFTADKAIGFFKKAAEAVGQNSSEIGSIAKLLKGYDNVRIGFKLTK